MSSHFGCHGHTGDSPCSSWPWSEGQRTVIQRTRHGDRPIGEYLDQQRMSLSDLGRVKVQR